MKQKYPAKLLFSVSMAIFGTIGVFTRLISVSSSEIALYRAVLAAIVIALFLIFSKKNIFKAAFLPAFYLRKKHVTSLAAVDYSHIARIYIRY